MPGDVYVLNAPYNGGTHLPDVTVITPVFSENGLDEGSKVILFYVASRGHHADIGGITPGSMPPDSREVEEEGVLIDNFKLVDQGRFREAELRALLASGKYPARNAEQNVADLKAQVAANERGVQELRRMVEQFGLAVVHAYMGHVQDNAEEQVRRVHRPPERRRHSSTRWTTAPKIAVARHRRPQGAARAASISPAPRRSGRTISTRPRRSPRRRCSTSSAP